MWQGWVNGILGIWLIITAFFGASRAFYAWDNFIVGIIIAICGFSMLNVRSWQGTVSIIVGIWLIISAFIPQLHYGAGVYWNDIISGVVALIAGFAAAPGRGAEPYRPIGQRPMQRPA